MIARVHVNQHIIKANKFSVIPKPPLTVKTSRGNEKASEVVFTGPAKLVYRPDKPLDCGAHVWIECQREDLILS
jgi:hypothetical protein